MRRERIISAIAMEVCTFLKVNNVISRQFWCLLVPGFGFSEMPNLGISNGELLWPLHHCFALSRWYLIKYLINFLTVASLVVLGAIG
jgi:hypothetical protein